MIARICWAVLGLIHLLPALALFRPAMIGRLYGVETGSTAFLLLHHRAALFLSVLLVCLWALARPEVRPLASVAVGISMLSFLWLYLAAGQPAALRQIAIADVIGLPAQTRDARNEIRAVYGGFPLAVAALVLWSLTGADKAEGILLALAVASLGMAVGRLVSAGLDGGIGRLPALFVGVELVLATLLANGAGLF